MPENLAPRRASRALAALPVALLLALSGCSLLPAAHPAEATEIASPSSTTTSTPPDAAKGAPPAQERVDSGEAVVAAECEAGPGRTVEQLPDVLVPAVEAPAVHVDAHEVAGSTVPVLDVPAVDQPAAVADGGCVVRWDAPADCLGRVDITAATIPAVRVPGVRLAGVRVGDDEAGAAEVGGVSTGAVVAPAVSVDQVCQRVEDDRVLSVLRPSLLRPSALRASVLRGSVRRGSACDGECEPSLFVPSLFVPSAFLASAFVPSGFLTSKAVDASPDVTTYTGEGRSAWVAPSDVLFDVDSAELRPDAAAALAAVAAQLPAAPAALRVEGHTDADGDDAHNDALSERRAAAVAQWLEQQAGVDPGRLTTAGYGEHAPVAPNETVEGRQANRRVVVTAAS